MGSHTLSQEIFLTQGLNPGLLHCRQNLYCLSHQGSPNLPPPLEKTTLLWLWHPHWRWLPQGLSFSPALRKNMILLLGRALWFLVCCRPTFCAPCRNECDSLSTSGLHFIKHPPSATQLLEYFSGNLCWKSFPSRTFCRETDTAVGLAWRAVCGGTLFPQAFSLCPRQLCLKCWCHRPGLHALHSQSQPEPSKLWWWGLGIYIYI